MKIKNLALIIAASLVMTSAPIIGAGAATSTGHEVQAINKTSGEVRFDFLNNHYLRSFTLHPEETRKEDVQSYSNSSMIIKSEDQEVTCVFPHDPNATNLIEFIAVIQHGLPLTCEVKF